ncbi:isocitrate/isopropylmalate family dehydrogenase [Saccharopolyspora sp. TS4A08]|uniref:Isocitrate/isopropylmalate family dehydrogenase n=1 Tax=Saccharopolyspora ipomoeae TaxID=3042027 RepID=A0ABT6PI63_9PSEU|nr:isocitrate/isopropylmalate family dehydrogenase [Saccharopolyspora sp. TS4A08]MDI2027694.1 isocitrate/isopropylmalate family dehydrogenase [Saccharopolyspora sp. TS4A08]
MQLLVLPGDGIGPEITDATLRVLTATDRLMGLGLECETHDIGAAPALTEAAARTRDMRGSPGTEAFTLTVIAALEEKGGKR